MKRVRNKAHIAKEIADVIIMLQLLYRWLESLGYEPSTEEQALRDSSNELYHREAKK